MTKAVLILFLFISTFGFTQKPHDGIFMYKFYDLEYNKVNGICKVIIDKGVIKVIAIEDCHRKKGDLILKGRLKKSSNINRWFIVENNSEAQEDYEYIDIDKRIFYCF